ncbi:MAG: ABC transporter ATP-binding protein [Pseudomonadota bacterium]
MYRASVKNETQDHAGAAELVFDDISHDYQGHVALEDITLRAAPGEVLCLIGPSGSGKTTLLRLAAGLEAPSRGRILLNQLEIAGLGTFVPPERRGVGLMFQDFALFPHMNVIDNVRFGLAGRAGDKDEAMLALERVGLAHYAKKFPHALSGGEQQRVALARALSPRPSVLLMDEPFSGLDARLRDSVREDTLAILRKTSATVLMVTHDAEEAMRVADHVALLNEGRLVQYGTAEDLYYRPVDLFTAAFFSELNTFESEIENGHVLTPFGKFEVSDDVKSARMTVAVRPSALELNETKGDVRAQIESRCFLGSDEQIALVLPDTEQVVRARIRAGRLKSGLRDVMLCVNEHDIMMFESG